MAHEMGEAQPATPPATDYKKTEESKVKTIQLSFDKSSADEMKLYSQIVKDADGDERKPPVYLMRYLKKHYGKGE